MKEIEHIKHFDMSDAVKRAEQKWLEEAGIAVTGQAKELAPVKTGRLKGSIDYRVTGDDCEIGTDVEYAEYMEYGTAKFPTGKPFLRPALRMMRPKLKARWKVALKEAQRA